MAMVTDENKKNYCMLILKYIFINIKRFGRDSYNEIVRKRFSWRLKIHSK